MNIQSFCNKCGGQLIQQDENTYKCKFCDAIYREDTLKKEIDALSTLLDDDKREKISNLKKELWKKVNETYIDSAEILNICREIKKISPDDFYANFYEAANSDNDDRLVNELECMDVIEHYDDVEQILDFCLKSITPKNMLAICNLIERAFKQNDLTLYNEYRTKYDEQCSLVNDCIYDPAYPRDVFVCYSSKDMAKVESLVKFLEEQGLLCFVAIRNLQHGRGAVQNYWNAIHTAIENCKCVVFLSSTNSRDMHCDALQELRYILSLEHKLNRKIKKIEYLLENYTGAHVERNFKHIFEGLEYCYDEETVYDRIMWDDEDLSPVANEPQINVQKEVKFCCNCGKENPENAKFCFDCANDEFVATQAEYIECLKKQKEELERQRQNYTAPPQQTEGRDYIRGANSAIPAFGVLNSGDFISGRKPDIARPIQDSPTKDHPASVAYEQNTVQGQRPSSAALYEGNDYTELIKGQNVLLQEGARKARVTISNEYKLDNVAADLYVFLLDNSEQVLSESDLVFFGNPSSLNKSVNLSGDDNCSTVDISFNKINQDVAKIRFIMSLNMEDGRIRNFSMLKSSDITIQLEDRAFQLHLSDLGRFESIIAIEFFRVRNKWKLSVQVAGLKEGIGSICNNCGIEVE